MDMSDFKQPSLDRCEYYLAAQAAIFRRFDAMRQTRSCKYGGGNEVKQWGYEIEACAAEALVAKWLGVYWFAVSQSPTVLPGDAGQVEVRHTAHKNGHLMLYPSDKENSRFVLVAGNIPDLEIKGWIVAKEGMKTCYYRTKAKDGVVCDGWWVPQNILKKPEELAL
jgi:hypothetical protein